MQSPEDSAPELGSRLESWKEIASYLGRDIRTAQRWEKSEGLPVHRQVHESGASVYAYTAELDAWRAQRARRPLPAVPAVMHSQRPFRPAWAIVLVLALALITTGDHLPTAVRFQERDWVLLEAFENRTGETLFDGTLRAALERELSNSEFLSVAPRERVEDALRLMRKPLDTILTPAEAREVCVRDGGIRVLVTGRTEKLGSTYLVSAEVIDPERDRTLASDTETAAGPDQIWPAVRRLSNWVRETLGEARARIDRSNQQLEKVTTPSLRALQLFTEAVATGRRNQWSASAQILRAALAEDPDFAAARLSLARALQALKDLDWKLEAQRAFDLSDRVSERERYFLIGNYERMMGRPDRAIPPFEALLHRYPDPSVYQTLAALYKLSNRVGESDRLVAEFAAARPNNPTANLMALTTYESVDLGKARQYALRLTQFGSVEGASSITVSTPALFHVFDLWMRDDARGTLAELERITPRIKASHDPSLWRSVINFQWTLGRFHASEELIDSLPEADKTAERAALSNLKSDLEPDRSFERLRREVAEGASLGIETPLKRVDAAVTEGRFAEAAAQLQQFYDQVRSRRLNSAIGVADELISALERSGDSQKALQVMEETSALRGWASGSAGPFWLLNQSRLSAYYHRVGREREAGKIDDQLRKLLAVADPDYPILLQLNSTQARQF